MYIKVRLYITYPENHLMVDKAVSDDKNVFFGGGGGGVAKLLKSEKQPDYPHKQSVTVYKYRVQCRRFNGAEDVHYVLAHITCRVASSWRKAGSCPPEHMSVERTSF